MGFEPIFLLLKKMSSTNQFLTDLVRKVVEPMGYELLGVQYLSGQAGGSLLRVYIDSEHGILLEDCTKVSHQLSGVLDVEDPIPGEYNLEISSPGMDRPLFTLDHYQRFVGGQVDVRLLSAVDGRRKLKGKLIGVEGDLIQVEVDGEVRSVSFDQVREARLVPEF